MLMRALAALLLLAGTALADDPPVGFTASLTNASAPATGSAVDLGGPKSSVVMLLSYTGSGGELVIEGSVDGVTFTPSAYVPLDPAGNPQVRVYFDRAKHQSPDPNRAATSRDPLVAGPQASFVRARLASVSGASAITATFGQ